MASQDRRLADALIAEEPVGGLRRGPVLAREGQTGADRAAQPLEQRSQPLAEADIRKGAAGEFRIKPRRALGHRVHGTTPRELVPDKESCPIPLAQAAPGPATLRCG